MVFRRSFWVVSSLLAIMLLAACGSPTTSSGSPAAGNTPAPTATAAPSDVNTATATVGGTSETILVDAKGNTLYYYTPDTATTVACTGGCAKAWPPLVAASSTPTAASSLTGTLSTISSANGSQITYAGYPLYTFSGDTAAGQTTGQGHGSVWYVATPSMTSFVIRVTTATVAGKSEDILTDAKGNTLYYYTPDTATTVACTAACATAWPPALFSGTGKPAADAPLTGTLSTVSSANGIQIEYNGHPLYAFSGDKGTAGQTTGQGLHNVWYVATPTLAA